MLVLASNLGAPAAAASQAAESAVLKRQLPVVGRDAHPVVANA